MFTRTVTSQSAVKLSGGIKSGIRAAAGMVLYDQSRGAYGQKGVL